MYKLTIFCIYFWYIDEYFRDTKLYLMYTLFAFEFITFNIQRKVCCKLSHPKSPGVTACRVYINSDIYTQGIGSFICIANTPLCCQVQSRTASLYPYNKPEITKKGEGVRINSQCESCHSLDYWTCNQTLYSTMKPKQQQFKQFMIKRNAYARQQFNNQVNHSLRNFQNEFQHNTILWLSWTH